MSRILEIVDDDPLEMVAKRARKAFIRIGRVDIFDPAQFVKGRVGINGAVAYVSIYWTEKKERINIDIRARSDDELSRAADQAMYRFLDAYKQVRPEDLDKPDPKVTPRGLIIFAIVAMVVAYVVYRLFFAPGHQ